MAERLYNYRRRLPHYQRAGVALFITFRKLSHTPFSPHARSLIMDCISAGDGHKFELHAAVVMPDHVHLLLTPRPDGAGWPYSLPHIMKALKGASVRRVNKLLATTGHVWQDESFDHVLRCNESLLEKMDYISQNPVRKGLVHTPETYEWLYVQPGWH